MHKTISDWLNPVPLLAILRGIAPHEVDEVGDVLIELGYRILEVPLNSPDPYQSIAQLAKRYSGSALIGAGTVLKAGTSSSGSRRWGNLDRLSESES